MALRAPGPILSAIRRGLDQLLSIERYLHSMKYLHNVLEYVKIEADLLENYKYSLALGRPAHRPAVRLASLQTGRL